MIIGRSVEAFDNNSIGHAVTKPKYNSIKNADFTFVISSRYSLHNFQGKIIHTRAAR